MIRSLRSALWLALPAMILASCEEPVKKKEKALEKLSWIEGEWFGTSNDLTMQEHWEKKSDRLYRGHAYVLDGMDTIHQEFVNLQDVNDTIYYSVFFPGKLDSTNFLMTKYENNEAIFENPDNDYPQKIVYRLAGDSLHARIEGNAGGEVRQAKFSYKRISGPSKQEESK